MDEVNAVLRGNVTQGRATSSLMHLVLQPAMGWLLARP